MKRRGVWQALLLLAALTAMSCGPEPEGSPPEASGMALHTPPLRFGPIHKALILSTRPEGEASHREAQAAAGAGLGVHVVTPAQWSSMTAEQFQGYRVLIIGDEACMNSGSSALQAAIDTRHLWGPAVGGNIFVIASDPSTNNTPVLVERGVEFALAREDATGLYVSLGCTYQGAAPGTALKLLEPFGTFTVAGVSCHPAGHTFMMSSKDLTSELYGNDDRLTGEGCAARTVFTHYPEKTFGTVALAVDTKGAIPGAQPYTDPFWNGSGGVFVGSPYVLARGAHPSTPSSPPVAQCWNRVFDADQTCGASGSIDNGSSDADGDLVGCTQSPAGPYPLGTTTVTLTCTDSTQQSSSCTATVHVRDVTAPDLALVGPASQQAECGTSYADPGAAANDFCDGDLSSAIAQSGRVDVGTPGTYGLTYDVADSSGNRASSARRTVSVRDTLPPVLTLLGPSSDHWECGMGYTDPGATATDTCEGNLTGRITQRFTSIAGEPDSYRMTYNVTDSSGNSAAAVNRNVQRTDTLPPFIVFIGPNMTVECGSSFTDPGAVAHDICAGTLPMQPSTRPDPRQPGVYLIHYSATDPSGNTVVTSSPREVRVVDTVPPSVVLNGAETITLSQGTPFVDPGATANDSCDGGLTVTRTGQVNTDVPSFFPYILTYTATDHSGNRTERLRYVFVTRPTPSFVSQSPTPAW